MDDLNELEELRKSIQEAFEEVPKPQEEDLTDIFLQIAEELNADNQNDI